MWFNDGDYWYLCDKCGVKLKHNECVVVCVGQETVAECCKPCAEVIRGEIREKLPRLFLGTIRF